MLHDESPDIYLKRRRLALDYFRHIPEARVNLSDWVDGPCDSVEAHYKADGLDALKCGAVACLAGWLWTLPEYRDWAMRHGKEPHNDGTLREWCGIREWNVFTDSKDDSLRTFYSRQDYEDDDRSDKAVALARLEGLIQEAEQAVRKGATR